MGIARDGWNGGAAAGIVVAVHEIGQPRGRAGRADEGVERVRRHHGVDPERSRQSTALVEGLHVLHVGERPLLLGHFEDLLAEIRHLPVFV